MLFAPVTQMVVVSCLVAAALALLVSPVMPVWRCVTWVALCLVTGVARLLLAQAFHRSEDRHAPQWLRRMTWLSAANGLAWGLSAPLIMPVHDLVTTSVIVSTLVGAVAISTFTLQSSLQANLAMNVPLLAPTVVMLASRMDPFGLFGSAGVFTLGLFMMLESRRAERRINELLWLRFTTDRIALERADALKLAQRHATIKDQFLATMSHEMRTPLHGMLGLADLIHKRLPTRVGPLADARQHAFLIQRAGQHLLTLINDVLDFSRIEAGRMSTQKQALELCSLLDDVVALSQVTAQGKGLTLHVEADLPMPCWVEGDEARLKQVLFNLLGNAIKFTEVGHVTLKAQRLGPQDQHLVRLAVEDSGIGIPRDMLDKVFDAFQQVDGTFGRRHQGTGLGLTISREIARAMGGDLMCSSEPGMGSVFWMNVPLPPCAAPFHAGVDADTQPGDWTGPVTEPAPSSGPDDQPPARHSVPPLLKGTVLLVEDNPVNALVAEAALSDMGLTVNVACGGPQALEMLVPGPHGYDVVLMDCQMPELDGLEVTRRLRAHEHDTGSPNVPVIALTANAFPEDRTRCTAAGMDDHLAKPFSSKELAEVLSRHLVPHAITV